MTQVGFVGAGRMGTPMIERLVSAGHHVRALARTDEKRAAVQELGATAVVQPQAVAVGAEVVVVCVFTDEQVRRVCLDDGLLDAMGAGSVLVVHTTGSPRTAELLAARTPGVAVVDAPVSGGPHDIAAGRITLFVGGDEGAVERARPVLAAYGDPIVHTGRPGSGQWVKLLNNTLLAAQLGLLREAAAFGARVGVDERGLLSAIRCGSGASKAADMIGTRGQGSVQDFIDSISEFLGKDVAVIREVAAETGNELGILEILLDSVVPADTPRAG
ncbi:6-phosphogluconate dehydrogenase [Mycolicibacterium duvalii]|uniref:6-phosphogluconate dehydrogenase n=1 Tax=Mycolicibacterium duvalii TaxID=39688 RepID=A0A7I7JX28_9MYCO|nr:NAD(P)-dependent oxidoreductase [Mycolicibacterium duvalii]MCV7370037.1 NAD(P)-dependent oxidoreductase [Mycolicibacterium duvalii]PEG40780.1 6-phosphogluconate dehydrogenase [Mycolicibacterium duvalii]BBX15642.1 6-phosphogluconate dehydrogenase [Mycolicibacterium duvalii]